MGEGSPGHSEARVYRTSGYVIGISVRMVGFRTIFSMWIVNEMSVLEAIVERVPSIDWDAAVYGDWGLMDAFWANPLNLGNTIETVLTAGKGDVDVSRSVYTAGWTLGIPAAAWAMGMRAPPAMAGAMALGPVGVGIVGVISSAYFVHSVQSDPAKVQALESFYSSASSVGPSTRRFTLTPGFGSMV